jgi:hypothetical protein
MHGEEDDNGIFNTNFKTSRFITFVLFSALMQAGGGVEKGANKYLPVLNFLKIHHNSKENEM